MYSQKIEKKNTLHMRPQELSQEKYTVSYENYDGSVVT
jgi:hypothetical protein